jgi:hypothetical protein
MAGQDKAFLNADFETKEFDGEKMENLKKEDEQTAVMITLYQAIGGIGALVKSMGKGSATSKA